MTLHNAFSDAAVDISDRCRTPQRIASLVAALPKIGRKQNGIIVRPLVRKPRGSFSALRAYRIKLFCRVRQRQCGKKIAIKRLV